MTILLLAEIWLYAGLVVAIVFLAYGIDRVEENSRGAYLFRPLLVPGILLLWPLVLARWAVIETKGYDAIRRDKALRGAHWPVWLVLSFAIPALFVGALLVRQQLPPQGDGAVRLTAPER